MVSVVRKVIKEEQNDSSMGVETDNKEGFKDIVKAADDFALKGWFWKRESTKTKSTREKGKEIPSKKETSQIKSKSKGNPKGNTKGKKGKSTQSNKTDGKGPKNVGITRQDRGEKYSEKVERKTQEKVVRKGKKQRRQEWRQSKER